MIYVFLADGFEETEALVPVDVWRRAGFEVKTVGVTGDEVTGSHGITVRADCRPDAVALEQAEAVVLPGGMPGTVNLENSEAVRQALAYAAAHPDVWMAAICAAPSVLGHAGLLKGRCVTCYPGFETALEGTVYTAEPVVVDGRVLTARGAGVALEFGLRLVSELKGAAAAQTLKESMQCR